MAISHFTGEIHWRVCDEETATLLQADLKITQIPGDPFDDFLAVSLNERNKLKIEHGKGNSYERYQHLLKQIRMSYCVVPETRENSSSRNLQSSVRIMINEFLALLFCGRFFSDLGSCTSRDSFNDNASPFNFNSSLVSFSLVLAARNVLQLHHSHIIHRISERLLQEEWNSRTKWYIWENLAVLLHNTKLPSIILLYYISINFWSSPWLQPLCTRALCLFDFNLMIPVPCCIIELIFAVHHDFLLRCNELVTAW